MCCRQTGDCGRQEALADGNGKGSDDDDNKVNKESEGNNCEGNKGNGVNYPKGGGRQWTQQSTRY